MVFVYLDVFATEEHFKRYLPEYNNLDELKEHYKRGGLGDVKIKLFLNNVLQDILRPIRTRREELSKDIDKVIKILIDGSISKILSMESNMQNDIFVNHEDPLLINPITDIDFIHNDLMTKLMKRSVRFVSASAAARITS